MKIETKLLKKYIRFLENNKQYVGFADWNIKLATNAKDMGDSYAQVEADIYEKIIKVELSLDFLKKTPREQCNILFHELVHGRISAFKKRCDEHNMLEEEHMVNDLVRGFEKYSKFKM